jgi:hypothetical protein
MRPHHRQSVEKLKAHFESNPDCLALIIGGSVAHGVEREDSDVDFMLVLTDEAYAKAHAERRYHHFATEFTDYPGGYSDGKLMDIQFLRDVAERGSDPARFAFQDAFVAFSRVDGLDELIRSIPVYPEAQHQARIMSFCVQLQALKWFAGEAHKRADPYLMAHVATSLSLFACRLILTHNRMLYPYHKWLLTYVDKAPEKPEGLCDRVRELVVAPTIEGCHALADSVLDFRDWGYDPNSWAATFFEDVEWTWRYGKPGIEDW